MGLKGALLFCTKIHTDGDYKMTQKALEYCNLLFLDDEKSVQIAGGVGANSIQSDVNLMCIRSTFDVILV